MDSSKMIAASFFLMMASLLGAAIAKEYYVDWAADTNYVEWASNIAFLPGDKLGFNYDANADNVVVELATEDTFTRCASDPTENRLIGLGELVVLEHSGPYYFINGYPNACTNGWKLQVNVLPESDAAAAPPPPPSPATPAAPFFPVTPTTPFFPVTPAAPFSPQTPPHRSGGAPSSLCLSTLTLPLWFFVLSLFMH